MVKDHCMFLDLRWNHLWITWIQVQVQLTGQIAGSPSLLFTGGTIWILGITPRNASPRFSNGKVEWSYTGYDNAKLPKVWLWPHSLHLQTTVLTKELEVSVAVSQGEYDVFRAAGVLSQLGLPQVGSHHLITLSRRWILTWNTKRYSRFGTGHFLAS